MRTIHKFLVPFAKDAASQLPPLPAHPSAPVRHTGIDTRSGQPAVWLEVDTDQDPGHGRQMHAFGTGHPIPLGLAYVGSMIDGSFVWHIYETHRP